MRAHLLFFVFLLSYATSLCAAELTPFVKNGQLGVTIKELRFPETLSKDLMSGLSNTFLVRLQITDEHNSASLRVAQITIKYDLWEENFSVLNQVNDSETSKQILPNLKAALLYLAELKVAPLWSIEELGANQRYNLQADVLFNPIQKEQMEKVRAWVIQNSTTTSLDPTGAGTPRPVVPTRSNSFFNKIFEQYSNGNTVAASWRERVSAKPFRLNEVKREK
jgi:hypothetical protein